MSAWPGGRDGWRGDPFTATFGRGPPPPPVLQRWLPSIHQQQKEIALGLAFLFAVLALCLGFYCLDSGDRQDSRRWARRPWIEASCSIRNVGVAYRGDCDMDSTLRMAHYQNFAECQGPSESGGSDIWAIRRAWKRSAPGRCARRGNLVYSSSAGPPPVQVSSSSGGADMASQAAAEAAQEEVEEADSIGDVSGGEEDEGEDFAEETSFGRRLQIAAGHHRSCHNGYLLWAEVVVKSDIGGAGVAPAGAQALPRGRPRCAYQFGAAAPSVTGDWRAVTGLLQRLQGSVGLATGARCWYLPDEDCVVALDEAGLLAQRASEGASLARKLCFVLIALALGAAAFAGYLHTRDHGCCGILPPQGYDSAVATSGPSAADEEVPLSERVRGIVSTVSARFNEVTPSPTPGRGSNSVRNLEVTGTRGAKDASMKVPANVAADFLEFVPSRADEDVESCSCRCLLQ